MVSTTFTFQFSSFQRTGDLKFWICPLSTKLIIMISATPFHSPFGLLTWVPYHYFSQPSPRYHQHPNRNLSAYVATLIEFATQFSSFPGVHHTMSLNMVMNMILPWNCSGSHFSSAIMFWISLRIHNVVIPGKSSTRIPSVLHQFDTILWDSVFPNTISFCRSKLELVLDWCLPSIAPSQKRRRFWISWFEKLCHTAEMTLSTKAGPNESWTILWSPSALWSTSQLSKISAPQTSKIDSWRIVNSMNNFVQDELQLEVWQTWKYTRLLGSHRGQTNYPSVSDHKSFWRSKRLSPCEVHSLVIYGSDVAKFDNLGFRIISMYPPSGVWCQSNGFGFWRPN